MILVLWFFMQPHCDFFFEPDPTSTLLLLTLTTYQQLQYLSTLSMEKKVFLKLNGSSSQALPPSFFEVAVVLCRRTKG